MGISCNAKMRSWRWASILLKMYCYHFHACTWSCTWCNRWILLFGAKQNNNKYEKTCVHHSKVVQANVLEPTNTRRFGMSIAYYVVQGWLGMFAFLDYMHYCWKNCAFVWQGQFTNKNNHYFIIIRVVLGYSLWIWHWHFVNLDGNNDINVSNKSHLISNMFKV